MRVEICRVLCVLLRFVMGVSDETGSTATSGLVTRRGSGSDELTAFSATDAKTYCVPVKSHRYLRVGIRAHAQ